jgi:hypothetical protein
LPASLTIEDYYQLAMKRITSPAFAQGGQNGLKTQMNVIHMLIQPTIPNGQERVFDRFPLEQQEIVLEGMCKGLGWVSEGVVLKERMKKVLELKHQSGWQGHVAADTTAIRRALRFRQVPRTYDEPGSKLYPNDGAIGYYLDMVHDNEAPIAFHFWTGLAAIGALMRRNFVIDRGAWVLWPNSYLILVGPTAAKKSLAIGCSERLVRATNAEVWARQEGDWNSSNRKQQKMLDRRVTVVPTLSNSAEFMADHLAVKHWSEAKVSLWRDSIGIYYNDELATLASKDKAGSGRIFPFFTKMYDCDDDTDGGGVIRGGFKFKNVCFTVVLGSTGVWIREEVNPNMFTGGFIGRCVFVHRRWTDRVIPGPTPLDPILSQDLAEHIADWTMMRKRVNVICEEGTEAYDRVFVPWYAKNRKRERAARDPKVSSFLNRYQNHAMQLAMRLLISELVTSSITPGELEKEGSIELEARHLTRALAILDFEEPFALECFEEISPGDSPTAQRDRVLQVIVRLTDGGKKPVPFSAVARGCRNFMSAKVVKGYVEDLKAEGRVGRGPGMGKAKTVLMVEYFVEAR